MLRHQRIKPCLVLHAQSRPQLNKANRKIPDNLPCKFLRHLTAAQWILNRHHL